MRDQDRPTWVIRLSGRFVNATNVAYTIARVTDNGADITDGVGVWKGDWEPSVTITMQATEDVLQDVLYAIARDFSDVRWVHVEEHHPQVRYVDLDSLFVTGEATQAV